MSNENETKAVVHQKTVKEVVNQVAEIQRLMNDVMKKGVHYGVIPGCGQKPALLKPGAEKINLSFKLRPEFETTKEDLEDNHRSYVSKCTLVHYPTGDIIVKDASGECSTMETKHRYYRENRQTRTRPLRYPPDQWNACRKLSEKRSIVAAVLYGTAASDIFTQDIDELPLEENGDRESRGKTEPPTKEAPPETQREVNSQNGDKKPWKEMSLEEKQDTLDITMLDYFGTPEEVEKFLYSLPSTPKLKSVREIKTDKHVGWAYGQFKKHKEENR